jgi:uncharacterized protein YqgQ
MISMENSIKRLYNEGLISQEEYILAEKESDRLIKELIKK